MSSDQASTGCAQHLVTLITKQDDVVQGWVQHLVTIQAGLVVALGFFLRHVDGKDSPNQAIPRFYLWGICLFGVVSALALTLVILRERRWQKWYVHQFNELPRELRWIFPRGDEEREKFFKGTFPISCTLCVFTTVVASGWIVAGTFLHMEGRRSTKYSRLTAPSVGDEGTTETLKVRRI